MLATHFAELEAVSAARVAAVREAFEEARVLIGSGATIEPSVGDDW